MIACYKTNAEIVEEMSESGVKVTRFAVASYRQKPEYKAMIEKQRQDFDAKIFEEEFASKRRRVQELTRIFWRQEKRDKNLRCAVDTLKAIKEEVNPSKYAEITMNQYNQYNHMSDDELRKIIAENSRVIEQNEKKILDIKNLNEPGN